MKLNILSDLHLSQAGLPLPETDAEVVILAGDIARPDQAFEWAIRLDQPVLYVPGNHEFYGGSIPGNLQRLRQLSAGSHVRVLDRDEVHIGPVRFLGVTLWTDFLLDGEGEGRATAVATALRLMRDFQRIHVDDAMTELFTPARCAEAFARDAAWLAGKLAQAHDGPTVVITHHAPSPRSIHPRFAGSPLNACFVSNAQHLLDGARAQLWVHGHTHDSFDYVVNGTRVICNPRGYARDGVNENASFDANFTVSVKEISIPSRP
jgi:predicted phosphodiesterase